jgi:hypothetical protein
VELTQKQWVAIGKRISARRVELGYWAINDAERNSDVSASTWSNMERGYRIDNGKKLALSPQPRTIMAIAAALGWGEDWLERLAAGEDPVEKFTPRDVTGAKDANAEVLADIRRQLVALTEAVAEIRAEMRRG